MNAVRIDFETRVTEVESYLRLIRTLEENLDNSSPDMEGLKAMKAGAHLLIYNLVEATASGIFEVIFDELKSSGTHFDDLIQDLRKIVLKNAQKPNVDDLVKKLNVLTIDIIDVTFDRSALFSGNVDSRKIRESIRSLGVSMRKPAGQKAKLGANSLHAIKRNRNDLAHGRKSFADVGKSLTIDELEAELSGVQEYLNLCLKATEQFVETKSYLVS